MTHIFNLRTYFEDTDAGGVVYHANYLNFCERARTEMLRESGFTNMQLKTGQNVIFVVRKATCDYIAPAYLEDDLTVQSHIPEIRNTSLTIRQDIYKGDDKIFTADIVLVCVSADKIKPIKIPTLIKDHFTSYLSQTTKD